jgi:hypothetical protein
MIYGEISEDASSGSLCAASPFRGVFQQHDRFMEVSQNLRVSFPPLGVMPSLDMIDGDRTESLLGFKAHYQLNEWVLMGEGDILLLHTDGLVEHRSGDDDYFPGRLEQRLREVKGRGAREIFEAIMDDVLAFGAPSDDISVVVIKRA